MDRKNLKELFEEAKEKNMDVCLELTVPTRDASEFIIVLNENLEYKLDYYLRSYNENLELERCTDIKILSAKLINWEW